MELNGIAAIVTGGASGLGGATARMLADAGAKVAIFDRDVGRGAAAAEAIGGLFVAVDVTDEASIAAGLDAAQAAHGVARLLVNCAGVAPGLRIVDKKGQGHPVAAFRQAIEINLVGTFATMAGFAQRLIAAGIGGEEAGLIVNTASVAAFDGQIGQAAYAASKGGVAALTLPAARDLAQHRIRVMTIAPGVFLTPMVEGFTQEVQDSLGKQVPHPSRLGRPAEYADLVRAIAGNPMLNGETIRLDGAIRMAPR